MEKTNWKKYLEKPYHCSCGKTHVCSIEDIIIEENAIERLPEILGRHDYKKLCIVCDINTKKVAGDKVCAVLDETAYTYQTIVFQDRELVPDEEAVTYFLTEIDRDCDLIIGVGSGTINDLCRFISYKMNLDYYIVGTAPSMDGYVADGAPIISHGYKYSPVAHLTYGLIGDTDILQTAPQDLIQAGYGDVIGKITAIADWDLAVKANGDYRCDTCVTLVQRALDKCFDKAAGLKTRDAESLGALLEALTLTGVAMALVNISRPASGAEHMLSHFWEMDYIARGLNPNHHGIQVGVATPVIARFFEELEDILPEGTKELCPSADEIKALLEKGGAPTSPKEIGIDRELFRQSLLKGYTVRPRYSILQFAKDQGRLEEIAEKITKEIYG